MTGEAGKAKEYQERRSRSRSRRVGAGVGRPLTPSDRLAPPPSAALPETQVLVRVLDLR